MKKLRWPLLIALSAVAAIMVLLYTQQQAVIPDTPVNEVVIEPEVGGVYVEGLIGALGRLNPVLDTYNPVDRDVDRLLFSGLIRFDSRGLPQGDLVDSWGISADGLIYNFTLRAAAVWHDGNPVTSDDVIFTLGLLGDERAPLPEDLRTFWKQVVVERQDEKNLRFVLPEPFSPFLDYLTFGVLPAHLLGDLDFQGVVNDHFNLAPVGSGPYRFDRLIVEDGKIAGVALKAFQDYYGQKPYIEDVSFRYYLTAQAAFEAYQNGAILGISQVTPDVLPSVLREPKLNLQTGRISVLAMIFLNLDNSETAFLQDVEVRRALMMGLNRQWMIDHILGGQAILANGPIFPGTWSYFDGVEQIGYDPTGATTILRKAGYTLAGSGDIRSSDDVTMTLELLYPDDESHAALAEAVRDDWARLGLRVDLKGVSYEELILNYLEPRQYQAALLDLNLMQSPDPDPYPFWHQAQITGGQNYSKWDDRQASEYLEQARVTLDLAERIRLYRNFQVRFAQELPSLPLYYPVYSYAIDASVQGVRMGSLFLPTDRLNTITDWFLLARRAIVPQGSPGVTRTPLP